MGRSTCGFGSGPNPVIAATRALFFSKGPRVSWARSPEDEGDRRRERGDDKAEVDPGPISLGVLGKHEKMDHDPQTDRKSQRKPDEIAGGLVNGRKGLALGAAHAHGHDHERPDKHRTQSHSQYRSPSGMVDAGVPMLGGPSCCGLALIKSIWRILALRCPQFPAQRPYVGSVAPSAMPRRKTGASSRLC